MAVVHWRVRVPIGGLALLVLFNPGAQSAAGTGYQYISPLPGSSSNSASTNIILRQGDLIDGASLNQKDLITVSGSASGIHAGRIILSDDGRTIVFRPSAPFSAAESVTVTVGAGLRTERGLTIDPFTFQFRVAKRRIHPDDVRNFLAPEGSVERKPAPATHPYKSVMPRIGAIADSLPAGFPAISVTLSQDPTPGEFFLSNFPFEATIPNTPYLMTIDTAGQPVFYRQQEAECLDFKLQTSGEYTYFARSVGYFYAIDSTGSPVDSFSCGNGYYTDEHDLILLPNGHALMLGDDFQTVRMDTVVAGGDSSAIVQGIVVQELDSDKNVVFQWRTWDHFKITDATHEDLTAQFIDAVHSNAISMDTDGNLLLSSRHLDEITKIDRQTGDIIWRWGGKNNEFTFMNDTVGFSHQHAVRRILNGDITLFDNGNFHTPPFSRALEYRLDEQTKTATLIWQYRNSPDIYGSAMGYVQRLDNGNTVIGWGATNPSVSEVQPDGSKTFELSLPPGVYSYRAYKFNAPRLITAFKPVEGTYPNGYQLEQNYPNPFNPQTTITFSLPVRSQVVLTLYNDIGQRVSTLVEGEFLPGRHSVNWNAASYSSGAYFYRLQARPAEGTGNSADSPTPFNVDATRKMLLVK